MNRLIQHRRTSLIFLVSALAYIGLSAPVQAVSPAPDGGYPGANTAEGQAALLSLTTGAFNTAVGFWSLRSNATGLLNTGIGAGTLLANTGDLNTASGAGALLSNTVGFDNTANGAFALFSNSDGVDNTAIGSGALFTNASGQDNTAVGFYALLNNTGSNNVGIGDHTLQENTTGFRNTAVGDLAGLNVVTANDVTCIGAHALGADVSNSTWIANVYGVTTQNGTTAPVVVSALGQLGTVASSQRFKKDIAAMEKTSEAILSLRPVTFYYKTDTTGSPQFGLIAEEVANVNPDLVIYDADGKPYTVRYDAVNTMLLNEFLKAHRRMEEEDKRIEELTVQLKQQGAQIQKVSAQLQLSKPAPQTVINNQ